MLKLSVTNMLLFRTLVSPALGNLRESPITHFKLLMSLSETI